MEELFEEALDFILGRGAEFCDARMQDISTLGIRVVDGSVRSLGDSSSLGVALRARIGGAWGYATTVSLDREQVMETAAKAVRNAMAARSDGLPLREMRAITKDLKADVRVHPREMGLSEKIDNLMTLDKAQRIDGIVNRNSLYMEELRSNMLMNSFGSRISWEEVRTRFGAVSVSMESGRNEMFVDLDGGTEGLEVFERHDLNEFGARVANEAVRMLDAKRPPSGAMTVISDPMVSGLLAHEVMGHASEADEVVKRRSFLTDKVGETVASEHITMIDDGTVPGAFGSIPFDDEGTPSSRTTIIEDGVYKGYMHSLETATEMGVEPTGNGRAQDFGRRVWVRMTNTYFDAGDWTLEEMVEDVKDGVLCDRMLCGMEDPVGGGFEAKVLRGFRIENGEIGDMLQSFTVTGQALEILRSTDAVGRDVELDTGNCGKGIEDWVPVSSGGPYCRSTIIVGGG